MAVDFSSLKSAVMSRGKYIRTHTESLSMKAVRRLLEGDLGLETGDLDSKKGDIKGLVDKVLQTVDDYERRSSIEHNPGGEAEKPVSKQKRKRQVKESVSGKSDEGEHHGAEEDDGEEVEGREEDEGEEEEEEGKDEEEEGEEEEERPKRKRTDDKDPKERNKRKAAPGTTTQSHGRRCERLKEIIHQCGLRVPPAVYAKAKRASGDDREDILGTALEDILRKEGLPIDPTPKDITAAKKIIQKRKELEGIDTGNVILEPRSRRATAAAPKYDDSTSDTDEEEEDGETNEDDEDEEDGEGPGSGESAQESEEE